MKNLSLILNAILLVAVGVLYYLHFSGGKSSGTTESTLTPSDLKIAYINADTVLKYYEYLKTTKVKLEEKTKKMDADYRNRAMGLQNEIAAYQRNVSNMTLGQVKAVEEDLEKSNKIFKCTSSHLVNNLWRKNLRSRKNCTIALLFF